MWPLVLLGLAGAYDGAILEGLVLAIAFGVMWFWFATLAVEFSPEFVIVRRIGRVIWRANRGTIQASFGRGGELKTHSALILESPEEPKQFQILRTMFGANQVGRMAHMLGLTEKVPGGIF
jgi:hypothetical protein